MVKEYILVIEDDRRVAQFIERSLIHDGYKVRIAHNGRVGLETAQANPPDLVILDWLLADISGLDVCKQLRRTGKVPILMLTAKDQVTDRITGLDAGADDYLVKPFAFDELLARVRALLRRSLPKAKREILYFADLMLDPNAHEARRGVRFLELTALEYRLLELFMRNPGRVLTRELIFERVWHYDFGGASNIIEVYMKALRRKTEADGESRLLHTVRGVGYVLRED
jgi:two-component system, OmpR family, response regulator MprA